MPAPARAPPGDPDGSPPNGEQALYQAISRWRERLARDSARNNLALRSTEIAAAVNRIVFLLLFTRIAEDRGLVAPGTLDKIARAGDPLAGLAAVFGGADPWAGAGEPAGGTAARADPAIGASVVQALFAEASEPGFRPGLLPAGSVSAAVARYLGSTIRRSAAHQAIVVAGDRAPGSRGPAAGAVAEYLAETTLSAAAHRRSRRELLPLRVIDPACGAGGVLVPAYRRLVAMRAGASPSFAERAEILLDSVHGADPDPHAVAATRLALLIAVFGGDSAAALPPGDFPGTARDILTGLSRTIVRGDLTVGPEIVHEEGLMFATPRDRHAIRPLVWREAFPEIAAAGGFDAAVGDLPEGVVGQKEWLQQYFQRHYEVYDPDAERSAYYLERSCGIVRHGGVIGFCTGDGWLRKTAGLPLRTFLMRKEICRLADITAKPGDPAPGTCVLVIVNRTPRVRVNFPAAIVPLPPAGSAGDLAALVAREDFPVDPARLTAGGWTLRDTRREDLRAKLKRTGMPLEDAVMGQVRPGTGTRSVRFVFSGRDVKDRLIGADPGAKPFLRTVVSAADIEKYRYAEDRFAVLVPAGWTDSRNRTSLGPWRWFKRKHPALARLLKESAGENTPPTGPGAYWWESSGVGSDPHGRNPSLLFPLKFRSPAFAYDPGRALPDETVGVIGSSNLYLLGLLNSRLTGFFLDSRDRPGPRTEFFSWDDLRDLPVFTPDLDDPDDRARHDRIVALVLRMIDRRKKWYNAPEEDRAGRIEKETAAIARKIDLVLFDLYRLTNDEIALVESTVPPRGPPPLVSPS